jgi:ParB family chromosome partitioning protein
MDDARFQTLRKEIREEGFLVPVILRPKPAGNKANASFIIIDGEHRWRAAKAEGYDEIPAIVVDKDIPEAMISTINLNRLRGEFDSIKLAKVIVDLNKVYSIEELERKLGIPTNELQGLQDLAQIDLTDQSASSPHINEDTPQEYKFEVLLSADDYEIIDKALALTEVQDVAAALKFIALEYISNHRKKKNG